MSKEVRRGFMEEFKRETVRLIETSGRTISQIADELGVGLSTLTRWKRIYREAELLAGPHEDVNKELARLRKENEILRQEREILLALRVLKRIGAGGFLISILLKD